MKKILSCLLAAFGLSSACGQQNYETVDVQGFSELINDPSVVLLDVRSDQEFAEGHLDGAINIDQSQDGFVEKVKSSISPDKTLAIYCKRGRRSASAAGRLADAGFKCVSLKGGILAWKDSNMPVVTDRYETDVFKTKSGKTVKFHALMHASIRIEFDGKEIEIDPVGKLGDRTVDFTSFPKADYILVTHEHRDHFDEQTLKQLASDDTRLVTNQRCADMFGSGEVMANGDKLQLADDFTVEAVPAYNITEGHLQFHPKGRDNGYILTLDGLRVYIAGDTEDIPEMQAVGDIDIAFLPCNQPYTMTPDQLIRAATTVKPKVLFPYHYGQTDVSSLPEQLQNLAIDVRIRHYE